MGDNDDFNPYNLNPYDINGDTEKLNEVKTDTLGLTINPINSPKQQIRFNNYAFFKLDNGDIFQLVKKNDFDDDISVYKYENGKLTPPKKLPTSFFENNNIIHTSKPLHKVIPGGRRRTKRRNRRTRSRKNRKNRSIRK